MIEVKMQTLGNCRANAELLKSILKLDSPGQVLLKAFREQGYTGGHRYLASILEKELRAMKNLTLSVPMPETVQEPDKLFQEENSADTDLKAVQSSRQAFNELSQPNGATCKSNSAVHSPEDNQERLGSISNNNTPETSPETMKDHNLNAKKQNEQKIRSESIKNIQPLLSPKSLEQPRAVQETQSFSSEEMSQSLFYTPDRINQIFSQGECESCSHEIESLKFQESENDWSTGTQDTTIPKEIYADNESSVSFCSITQDIILNQNLSDNESGASVVASYASDDQQPNRATKEPKGPSAEQTQCENENNVSVVDEYSPSNFIDIHEKVERVSDLLTPCEEGNVSSTLRFDLGATNSDKPCDKNETTSDMQSKTASGSHACLNQLPYRSNDVSATDIQQPTLDTQTEIVHSCPPVLSQQTQANEEFIEERPDHSSRDCRVNSTDLNSSSASQNAQVPTSTVRRVSSSPPSIEAEKLATGGSNDPGSNQLKDRTINRSQSEPTNLSFAAKYCCKKVFDSQKNKYRGLAGSF